MTFDADTLNRLFRYCMALCEHRDDAYDLLQGALEKYLRHKGAAPDEPVAFIRRIARNQFIDDRRRRRIVPFEPLPEDDCQGDEARSLEDVIVDQYTLADLWQYLLPGEREALFLWAVEGMTAAEIAHALDEPRSTILARMRRARRRIEARLTQMGPDVSGQGVSHG